MGCTNGVLFLLLCFLPALIVCNGNDRIMRRAACAVAAVSQQRPVPEQEAPRRSWADRVRLWSGGKTEKSKTPTPIGRSSPSSSSSNSPPSPPSVTKKSSWASWWRRSPFEKVSTTPVFFICSSRGHPYLQEDALSGKSSQRVVNYFMSYEDANAHLNEMTQANYPLVNECRVMTVSLEKFLSLVREKKQSRKLGRYEVDVVHRIQPASQQQKNADSLGARLGPFSIPLFSAEKLVIARRGGKVVHPMYFAYEDLLADWKQAAQAGQLSHQPSVSVHDFADVMTTVDQQQNQQQQDDASSAGVNTSPPIGFVPPRMELGLLRHFYRAKGALREFGKARLLLDKK